MLAGWGANENTENSRKPPSPRQNVWYVDHRDSTFCDTKFVIERGVLHITIIKTHMKVYHFSYGGYSQLFY